MDISLQGKEQIHADLGFKDLKMLIIVLMGYFFIGLIKNSDKRCVKSWNCCMFYWPNMWKQFIAATKIPGHFDSSL